MQTTITPPPPPLYPSKGQSEPHESAQAQILGQAPYIDDLPEWQGTLHAALVLSPVAHGHLQTIDAELALKMPHVVACLTHADLPADPVFASFAHDEPILPHETVSYVGQVVAIVVAHDRLSAHRAAKAVALTITPLPAILNIQEAHQKQYYVLPPVHVTQGQVQQALQQAPHRLQGHFEVGGQEHFYLEGQIAYALPQENHQMLVYSSTQHPAEVQHWVAHALGLTAQHITIETRRLGGGFGGKETQAGHVAVWAALAARHCGAPVKLRLGREHDFLVTGKRHPMQYDYDVGFDKAGRLQGLEVTLLVDCGFSADLSGPVADRAVFHIDNAYALQHVAIHSYRCKTHRQSHTAFRGFGGPQGMILIERVMSDIAQWLQLDPLVVRLINLYGPEPERCITPYQMIVTEHETLRHMVHQLAQTAQYTQRRAEIQAWNAWVGGRGGGGGGGVENSMNGDPKRLAHLRRGLALTPVKFGISFTATLFNQAGALVHVFTDGSVYIHHGGVEMGQGLHTKVRQIVADELGIATHRIRVGASNTHAIPNASATAASSGTDLNGRAAQYAAQQIASHLAAFVAGLDGCGAGAIQFANDQVISPTQKRSFTQVVQLAYANRIQLWSDGFYRTPKIHYDKTTLTGRPFYYFAHGVACSEVVVDVQTGACRVVRVDVLQDVGRSLNPALDRGQIEGGFVQGMGWLMQEELVWDDQGRLLTRAPSTYKIPSIGDTPWEWHLDFWQHPNPEDNVGGSKAVGEPPFMLAISVFEAIRDALGSLATHHHQTVALDAPATPERVYWAAKKRRS